MKTMIHSFGSASIAVAAAVALQACTATPYQSRPPLAQVVPDFGRTQVIQQAATYRQGPTNHENTPSVREDLPERMERIRARAEASVDPSRPLQAIFDDAEALAGNVSWHAKRCYVDLETRTPGLPGCEAYFEVIAEFQGVNDALAPLVKRAVERNPKGRLRTNGEFAEAAASMQVVTEAMNRYLKNA